MFSKTLNKAELTNIGERPKKQLRGAIDDVKDFLTRGKDLEFSDDQLSMFIKDFLNELRYAHPSLIPQDIKYVLAYTNDETIDPIEVESPNFDDSIENPRNISLDDIGQLLENKSSGV